MEAEFIRADDDRMAGVVAALGSCDVLGIFCEEIDDLPFSFVPPLHANDGGTSHGQPGFSIYYTTLSTWKEVFSFSILRKGMGRKRSGLRPRTPRGCYFVQQKRFVGTKVPAPFLGRAAASISRAHKNCRKGRFAPQAPQRLGVRPYCALLVAVHSYRLLAFAAQLLIAGVPPRGNACSPIALGTPSRIARMQFYCIQALLRKTHT